MVPAWRVLVVQWIACLNSDQGDAGLSLVQGIKSLFFRQVRQTANSTVCFWMFLCENVYKGIIAKNYYQINLLHRFCKYQTLGIDFLVIWLALYSRYKPCVRSSSKHGNWQFYQLESIENKRPSQQPALGASVNIFGKFFCRQSKLLQSSSRIFSALHCG